MAATAAAGISTSWRLNREIKEIEMLFLKTLDRKDAEDVAAIFAKYGLGLQK